MADDRRTFADKTELQHVPLLRTFGPSLPLGVVATLVYVGVCAWTYLTHGS